MSDDDQWDPLEADLEEADNRAERQAEEAEEKIESPMEANPMTRTLDQKIVSLLTKNSGHGYTGAQIDDLIGEDCKNTLKRCVKYGEIKLKGHARGARYFVGSLQKETHSWPSVEQTVAANKKDSEKQKKENVEHAKHMMDEDSERGDRSELGEEGTDDRKAPPEQPKGDFVPTKKGKVRTIQKHEEPDNNSAGGGIVDAVNASVQEGHSLKEIEEEFDSAMEYYRKLKEQL